MISNNMEIPGLSKLSFRYKLIQDFIFVLVLVGIPSSFLALVPKSIFIDINLFFFFVSVIYLFIYFKHSKKIFYLPAGKILILLCVYLVFQISYSYVMMDIPISEVITIFRVKFYLPISALAFLLYLSSIDNLRIYRILYWIFLLTLIQGTLYIISNITGIDIFADGGRAYDFGTTTIMQNMFAIPHYNEVLFVFGFLALLIVPSFKKHYIWIIPLIITIISIVRSQIVVYFLVIILLIFFINLSGLKSNISRLIKLVIFGFVFIFISSFVFPDHVNRVIDKFGFNKKEKLVVHNQFEEGTFALRLRLIADAYERTEKQGNIFFGNGYIREARKGEYDFVIGSDTLIPSVLYTEGYLGLILRTLPIFIFLLYFLKNIRSDIQQVRILSVISISLLLPELVNVVQTKLFVFYTKEMLIIYLLSIIIYNIKFKEKNVT